MKQPSAIALGHAISAARMSPCAKSKRGVVVYTDSDVIGIGFNGPPAPGVCGVDEPCGAGMIKYGTLSACSVVCMHAEARALAAAGKPTQIPRRAIHVALDRTGNLVAGGGPSCWQCSKLVLEAEIEKFWLYEETPAGPVWKAYTAKNFHRQTLIACGLIEAMRGTALDDARREPIGTEKIVRESALVTEEAKVRARWNDTLTCGTCGLPVLEGDEGCRCFDPIEIDPKERYR